MKKTSIALTIASSDSSGGAGIQADLKTFSFFKTYGTSVICSITAQNTHGIKDIFPLDPICVKNQLESIFEDLKPDAIKIGMIYCSEIIMVIADLIKKYRLGNIILDPIIKSSTNTILLKEDSIETFKEHLIPLTNLITPNIPEGLVLANFNNKEDVPSEEIAVKLYDEFKIPVLLKGGHRNTENKIVDIYISENQNKKFTKEKSQIINIHGTGCHLSASIAALLATGHSLLGSIEKGEKYINNLIGATEQLGQGSSLIDPIWVKENSSEF